MEVEAYSIQQAETHCSQTKHNKVIIQTDYLFMQKILNKEWSCPWNLTDSIEQTWM